MKAEIIGAVETTINRGPSQEKRLSRHRNINIIHTTIQTAQIVQTFVFLFTKTHNYHL